MSTRLSGLPANRLNHRLPIGIPALAPNFRRHSIRHAAEEELEWVSTLTGAQALIAN